MGLSSEEPGSRCARLGRLAGLSAAGGSHHAVWLHKPMVSAAPHMNPANNKQPFLPFSLDPVHMFTMFSSTVLKLDGKDLFEDL